MIGKILSKCIVGTALCGATLIATAAPSYAVPEVCTNAVKLPGNFLYKPENVHGGRGPSFLIGCQQKANWPKKGTLVILGEDGSTVGKFRLYDPGNRPYGRRYYSGLPGGFPSNSGKLAKNAKQHGGKAVYVVANTEGLCFKINNPNAREGTLKPVTGGAC